MKEYADVVDVPSLVGGARVMGRRAIERSLREQRLDLGSVSPPYRH
jgi:hypothetical protein